MFWTSGPDGSEPAMAPVVGRGALSMIDVIAFKMDREFVFGTISSKKKHVVEIYYIISKTASTEFKKSVREPWKGT